MVLCTFAMNDDSLTGSSAPGGPGSPRSRLQREVPFWALRCQLEDGLVSRVSGDIDPLNQSNSTKNPSNSIKIPSRFHPNSIKNQSNFIIQYMIYCGFSIFYLSKMTSYGFSNIRYSYKFIYAS